MKSVMSRRAAILVGVPAILLAAASWYEFAGHQAPAGQPPLAELNAASLATFEAAFNRQAGEIRIVLLLSPT